MAKKSKRPITRKARAIRLGCFIACISLLCIGAFLAYRYIDTAINDPGSLFETAELTSPTEIPPEQTQEPAATEAVSEQTEEIEYRGSHGDGEAELTDAEKEQLIARLADKNMLQKDIVNILIIGVDYAYEREGSEWLAGGGKGDFHSDVMMVLAVNFKENKASLISLPRDTYANIPGVKGIYKLNASINCGGGVDDSGFKKVCEAAEWMLGGISVDYYYAVTMPAVKQLGEAVGGVDYDVEMDFSMAGRSYQKGYQHLNGQGILDYFRVRKGIKEGGDLNRINRQKKLLVALFAKLKKANKLAMIPDLLSVSQEIYTNTTLQQTLALAYFSYNLEVEDIGMYSMGGNMQSIFGWSFCITDQDERVRIIKEVYGVDAEKYLEYTRDYANFRWQSMLNEQYNKTTEGLQKFVEDKIAADFPIPPGYQPVYTPEPTASPTALPTPTPTPEFNDDPDSRSDTGETPQPTGAVRPTPGPTPEPTPAPTAAPTNTPAPTPSPTATPAPTAVLPTPQYDQEARAMLDAYIRAKANMDAAYEAAVKEAEKFLNDQPNSLFNKAKALASANETFRLIATALAEKYGWTGRLDWNVTYWKDPEFNEILVDFR